MGLGYGKVRICDSDPRWPQAFEQLAAELQAALGTTAVAIEHIGSTAVPGLAAKPILDIAVALIPRTETKEVIAALEPLGYIYRGDKRDQGGLLFVLEDRPLRRIAHIHAVDHDDAQWRRWLFFRDLLRTDPATCAGYDRLKRELAHRHAHNRQAYTTAKTSFVTTSQTPIAQTDDTTRI
ncbi:GrpB family protein [Actinomadura graeca]|uniref:GrpB family protein n=1 Tax=Actinomadura graeca TaxID=2750812 RepID=A0ABX8R016_9ACTN|nr:GrpB family protein [Actinomadura graeca]QXJ24238.1 GrpB family protein [Actinomadura graeca]